MLRTGFEDSCYEHIPLAKSGEDNRWIQLKEVDWGACFHTVDDCSTFFWADILQAKYEKKVKSAKFISRALDVLIHLVFPHDYIFTFLIVWKSYKL